MFEINRYSSFLSILLYEINVYILLKNHFIFFSQENILLEPMYETPNSDIEEIVITKETVVDKKPPVYIQRPKDLVVSTDKFVVKQTIPQPMKIMSTPPSQP